MSQYNDFFKELVTDVPYDLAVQLKDLPKAEWAEITQDWFLEKLYIGSYETLEQDQPLSELWEVLIGEVDWDVVVKLITKTKINKAIKSIEE
ncbi:hypothetical protein [Crocosphaera chwakensis]|uniref:Uncharacterized protein n=1 Tax=Crocosphaera chwakensis CCY0110 TaxID=391612 RepID=A3ITV9_9CHRO|nr:hypothetical protein [Crocosphaera chwakensis]EAZ90054.1 hypothetical protein CY0110_14950 [Crocosphaera chwakensis CCY0110]